MILNNIKRLFSSEEFAIVLTTVTFGFIFYWSFELFRTVFSGDSKLLSDGTAAFAGAFFAFLFLRLGEFLTSLYKRKVIHYNSLVTLEWQLNELGGIIDDNIYLIPEFKRTITSGNVYFSNLRSLPVDKTHYTNLSDLNFINQLFDFNAQVRKINDDIDTLTRGYSEVKAAMIEHHISPGDYLVNAQLIAEKLDLIKVFSQDLQEKALNTIAVTRLLSRKDKPLGAKLMGHFIADSSKTIQQREINIELEKLHNELEESRTRSHTEIRTVLERLQREQVVS